MNVISVPPQDWPPPSSGGDSMHSPGKTPTSDVISAVTVTVTGSGPFSTVDGNETSRTVGGFGGGGGGGGASSASTLVATSQFELNVVDPMQKKLTPPWADPASATVPVPSSRVAEYVSSNGLNPPPPLPMAN